MSKKMEWHRLLVEKRFRDPRDREKEEEGKNEGKNGRSQFEKDIDKITFSSAFRRLGRKTQVHLLSENDHIHTRLSHSLEVASVGRSLGVMVGQWLKEKQKLQEKQELPDIIRPSNVGEIVEAACLAHDIGNPPFGHAAEEAIRKWFQENINDIEVKDNEKQLDGTEKGDLRNFDGNAMAFRVVTYKEYYEKDGGMRLTYPTLGALMKYPWTSNFTKKNKFSCFKTEYKNLCEIAKELDLIEKEDNRSKHEAKYARHPLAYLVEAADDICYGVLDIEDAIELDLLPEDYLIDQELDKCLIKKGELREEHQRLLKNNVSWRIKNGLLRGKMINRMIKEIVEAFENDYQRIMEGNLDKSLMSRTNNDSLCLKMKALYEEQDLKRKIYRNQRNVPLELGAYSVIETLLENSIAAAREIVKGEKTSYKTKIIKDFIKINSDDIFKGKGLYEVIMLFLDYITGMTDNFATNVNKQLLGLGN
jgi:dGTPase